MQKRWIALFGVLTLLAVFAAGCTSSSLSGSGMSTSFTFSRWTISAKTINGHVSKTVKLASDTALRVKNTNSGGKVTVVLTQGNIVKTFDVSGVFDGTIDTSSFTPGKLAMRLNLESVKDINVAVNW